MTTARRLLVIDDQLGDLTWLLDLARGRGFEVVVAANEKEARARLRAVAHGHEAYALAIVDVMMAVADIAELVALDDEFFASSRDTGIRLCSFARRELSLDREHLPLICLTARDDEAVKAAMRELEIPVFNRAQRSARACVEQALPSGGLTSRSSERPARASGSAKSHARDPSRRHVAADVPDQRAPGNARGARRLRRRRRREQLG